MANNVLYYISLVLGLVTLVYFVLNYLGQLSTYTRIGLTFTTSAVLFLVGDMLRGESK